LNNFLCIAFFFLFKGLPELNIDELENYLMSIEQQNDSQNIQSLTGLGAEEIAEEVDLFFASVNKQQTDSSNIQSLTGLSAEEIGEEVDLFFATSQPIFENDAAISNVCETPEIGESNMGKRPASPQATSSKCRLQECTSEYTSVRKMIFSSINLKKKIQSVLLLLQRTMKSHIFFSSSLFQIVVYQPLIQLIYASSVAIFQCAHAVENV
jgi:hypothetical protein